MIRRYFSFCVFKSTYEAVANVIVTYFMQESHLKKKNVNIQFQRPYRQHPMIPPGLLTDTPPKPRPLVHGDVKTHESNSICLNLFFDVIFFFKLIIKTQIRPQRTNVFGNTPQQSLSHSYKHLQNVTSTQSRLELILHHHNLSK